jgi:alkylhydroperoxidase family enzyme
VGSRAGLDAEKILALSDYATSPLFDDRERAALEYADAMTAPGVPVRNELFARLRRHFDDDTLVELTALIAWENASSRFNRALQIPAQDLWTPPGPE